VGEVCGCAGVWEGEEEEEEEEEGERMVGWVGYVGRGKSSWNGMGETASLCRVLSCRAMCASARAQADFASLASLS
jgi:hypothetical protein